MINKTIIVSDALARHANGERYKDIAAEYGISDRTLREWKRKLIQAGKITTKITTVEEECKKHGIEISSIKHGWIKGKHFSLAFDYPKFNIIKWNKFFLKTPIDKIQIPAQEQEELIGVIGITDMHFYKHNNNPEAYFSTFVKVAEEMKTQRVGNIIFITGSDSFHVNNYKNTTSNGTILTTEGKFEDAVNALAKFYENCIDWCLINEINPIPLYIVGNHDDSLSYAIVNGVCRKYDLSMYINMEPRKYFQWGKTLIGFTHGDKTKGEKLINLMATEQNISWGETEHRYFLYGHLHHLNIKDYIGGTTIGMRSLSSTDDWHKAHGYISKRGTEGYIFSKKNGLTHTIFQTI